MSSKQIDKTHIWQSSFKVQPQIVSLLYLPSYWNAILKATKHLQTTLSLKPKSQGSKDILRVNTAKAFLTPLHFSQSVCTLLACQ